MPLLDQMQEKSDKKSVKNPPRPKREFEVGNLVFRKRMEDLRKEGRQNNDIDILTALQDTLNSLMPVAEENYQEYPFHTNAAAVNHLANQIRETAADIQALEDFGKRGELICDFISRQYKELLQHLITDLFTAQKAVALKPASLDDEMTKIRNTAAKRFAESDKTVRARITHLLQVKT